MMTMMNNCPFLRLPGVFQLQPTEHFRGFPAALRMLASERCITAVEPSTWRSTRLSRAATGGQHTHSHRKLRVPHPLTMDRMTLASWPMTWYALQNNYVVFVLTSHNREIPNQCFYFSAVKNVFGNTNIVSRSSCRGVWFSRNPISRLLFSWVIFRNILHASKHEKMHWLA